MPERPDLEHWVPELRAALVGARFTTLRSPKPVVLRCLFAETPEEWIAGRSIQAVQRHGPFVWFELGDQSVRIHPMLAGRFRLAQKGDREPLDLAVAFLLQDGRELWYRDDKQMGKVYLGPTGVDLPGWSRVGLDPLAPEWNRPAFDALVKKRRDQLKTFLLDHGAIDCLGNAYADEVCWHAQLHPKARVSELSEVQRQSLFLAIPKVLQESIDEIARRKPALDEKLRDFLAVRGRKDQPCPRCQTTLRTCGVNGYDAYFCPTCQPDEKGRVLVDWRKVTR